MIMDTALWLKIAAFDLDQPLGDYSFSVRLAHENFWTKDFTERAIAEYKKFMYLAATTDTMVSPSGVVDAVWHQHLVFTKSYHEFCALLGKDIQHVPSTHTKVDAEKFRQAKERTYKLYTNTFGDVPKDCWHFGSMYDSLRLPKAKWKIRSFLLVALLVVALLVAPTYVLLRPIYMTIAGETFLWYYIALAGAIILGLEMANRIHLSKIFKGFDKSTFIYRLRPVELVYMKRRSLADVAHVMVNKLFKDKLITIDNNNQLTVTAIDAPSSSEERLILETVANAPQPNYASLLRTLLRKPILTNVANSMDAFQKYFVKSAAFGYLFYGNFIVLAVPFLVGFSRLLTGLLRDKPVTNLVIALLVWAFVTITYLFRLTDFMGSSIIPIHYKKVLIPALNQSAQWEWQYFMFGAATFVPAFAPLVKSTANRDNSGSCSTSGSSCGSSDSGGGSDGGSCGSSCGGCGGD